MTRYAFSTTDLTQLQRQLSAWRRKQSGRTGLPEAVWSAAVDLARTQGPSLVARALRLDYYKLRQRLAGTALLPTAPTTFVLLRQACVSAENRRRGRRRRRLRGDPTGEQLEGGQPGCLNVKGERPCGQARRRRWACFNCCRCWRVALGSSTAAKSSGSISLPRHGWRSPAGSRRDWPR